MQTHRLLIYELISKRVRGKLFWLGAVLFLLGLYDLYVAPFLGQYWFIWWLALFVVGLLWFYYAVLLRRAKLVVKPAHLLLQGPLVAVPISYGRVQSVIATQFTPHINLQTLRPAQRALVKELAGRPCGFVALNGYPKRLHKGHLWFPRLLFSDKQTGLLIVVQDWMQLSRDVDAAHQQWREQRGLKKKADNRTLVGQILDW
jgi:hypothetical protein